MEGRHNDFKIKLYPQKVPNYWGNPFIWKMLLHAGLFNVRYVCKSRAREPYSMMYAFFNAVSRNQTREEVARTEGKKSHLVSFGNMAAAAGTDYFNRPYA